MKVVDVRKAKTILSVLLAEVEAGGEVIISRRGRPIAKLTAVRAALRREPGILRRLPEWRDFTYEPSTFAPSSDDELADEGWPE